MGLASATAGDDSPFRAGQLAESRTPIDLEPVLHKDAAMVIARLATRSDVARIRQIFNQAVEQSANAIEDRRRSLPEMVEWFERRSKRHPVVVAVMGQLVIGYGHLDPSMQGLGSIAQMSVKVDPRFADRQVEDTLAEELLCTAQQSGVHTVVSLVVSTDVAGQQLFRRHGFFRHGEMREVAYRFGQWISVVLLQRIFARADELSVSEHGARSM